VAPIGKRLVKNRRMVVTYSAAGTLQLVSCEPATP
jgi:hypothetical protein